jgi:hypothetical protein
MSGHHRQFTLIIFYIQALYLNFSCQHYFLTVMAKLLKFFLSWKAELTYAPSKILLLETQPSQYIKIYWLLCTVNDLLIDTLHPFPIMK